MDNPQGNLPPELTPEEAIGVSNLQQGLGYRFDDEEILISALRHRSYVNQFKESGEVEDNQRLEFLGDAVLSICVSTLLYHRFPDSKEGVLSRMRAGLVNESRLADLARDYGLDQALLLGRGEESTGGRDKNSILADAMEAVLGAIYLDGNLDASMVVVKRLWGDLVDRSSKDDLLKDFKTRLQEEAQKTHGQPPDYELTGSEGPDHDRTFMVTLKLAGETVSTGTGKSKKEAEQSAAKAALKVLQNEQDGDI